MRVPSVLLVDDDATFLRHARRFLEQEGRLSVLDTALSGPEGVQKAAELRPEVVLLDLSMPGQDGFQTVAELKEKVPGCRIIIVTFLEEPSYRTRALGLGVDGFVLKSRLVEDLIPQILQEQREKNTGEEPPLPS